MAVVDASVVVDWVAPGVDLGGPAGRLLDDLAARGESLRAPALLGPEVANALVAGVRRGRWSGADADASFGLLRDLSVQTVDSDGLLPLAWDLSRRFDEHPVYDMVYLAAARTVGDTLFTADASFVRRLGRVEDVVLVG